MKSRTPAHCFLIGIPIGVCLLFLLIIFGSIGDYTPVKKTQALSNIKQMSKQVLIYCDENDLRFPHATSMPTLRAQIKETNQRTTHFGGIKGYSNPSTFNFNLAGTKLSPLTTLPLSVSPPIDPSQVVMMFAETLSLKSPGHFVAQCDGSARFIDSPLDQNLDFFKIQFDRKGVTLAPPTYLADQDPLRK